MKKAPNKCVCGKGRVETKRNFTYYGCGAVAAKPGKDGVVHFSSCPRYDRKRFKGDMTKRLVDGSLLIDPSGKYSFQKDRT
jgi:hypothetical protein